MDLEQLIHEEQDGLTRRLTQMLGGDREAAQDLRQEVLVRAWRRLPRDAGRAGQRAWLHRTASNLALDELRRRARRPVAQLDVAEVLARDGAPEPDAAREALAQLDAHARRLLLLRFHAGFSHSEIGRLLSISEEAARKRVVRAREAFVKTYRAARADQSIPTILLMARDERTEEYVRWLHDAGARVRRVTTAPTRTELALSDGVVFTGATPDIDPALYGEEPRALRGLTDGERDRADLGVVMAAIALDKPFVGVCRGHQLLNVASGGTLYQDVLLDGATRESHDDRPHEVHTQPGSAMRSLLGAAVEVGSEHHQAVRRVGRALRVSASSLDGLVETIERTDRRFALGLQRHPEIDRRQAGDRVAAALVDAAAR